jgi:hypothetical protein
MGLPFSPCASDGLNTEIKAAGNCIASDLNTAAVFHLMRVVEFGLRALAAHLAIKINEEDIQYEQWQAILVEVKNAAEKATQSPGLSKQERAELREFYSGVLGEFNGFKDAWRNSVMHTRGVYNADTAMGLFVQVRDFMRRLAKKVSLD